MAQASVPFAAKFFFYMMSPFLNINGVRPKRTKWWCHWHKLYVHNTEWIKIKLSLAYKAASVTTAVAVRV